MPHPTPSRETAEIAGRISVDADSLHQVLLALVSPGHHIRELQFTRSLHKLGHPNPIDTLIENYEAARATGDQQS